MEGKSGELAELKARMETSGDNVDDPHDSWDADAFKKTLKQELDDPHDEWKQDDINQRVTFSRKINNRETASEDDNNPDDRWEFEKSKKRELRREANEKQDIDSSEKTTVSFSGAKSFGDIYDLLGNIKELSASDDNKASSRDELIRTINKIRMGELSTNHITETGGLRAKLNELLRVNNKITIEDSDSIQSKTLSQEKEESKDTLEEDIKEVAKENISENGKNPKELNGFEKIKSEWKEARDQALAAEKVYQDKYQDYLKESNTSWRYYAGLPRRMVGLQPKLTPELQALAELSKQARANHHKSGRDLTIAHNVQGKWTGEEANKVAERYERMLAHHLTIHTYKERISKQKEILAQADKNSFKAKLYGKAIDAIKKHKGVSIALAGIGAGVLIANAPVLAARMVIGAGVGLGARLGVLNNSLAKNYIKQAEDNLQAGVSTLGEGYFDKSFIESDKDMERLMFSVDARKERVKNAANTAGIIAGVTAAYAAGGFMAGGGSEQAVNSVPAGVDNASKPEIRFGSVDSTYGSETGDARVAEAMQPNRSEIPKPEPKPEIVGKASTPTGPASKLTLGSESKFTPETTKIPIPEPKPEPAIRFGSVDSTYGSETGDARVAEAMQQNRSEIPTPKSESGLIINEHTVVKDDNAWNIMEGKGPDSNPVGGKSEVIKDMSLVERRKALNTLFDYMDKNPEFTKSVGMSSGDPDRIFPGERIDISAMDNKLRELLNLPVPEQVPPVSENVPTPEPKPKIEGAEEVFEEEYLEDHEPPEDELNSIYEENITDVNQLTIGQVIELGKQVNLDTPESQEYLDQLGIDQKTFEDIITSLGKQTGLNRLDPNMTVGEYMNNTVSSQPSTTPPTYDGYDPFADKSKLVREASLSPINNEAIQSYARKIEKGTGGLFFEGKPDVSGTFEQIKNLSFNDIKSMSVNNNLPTGVNQEGWNRWIDVVNESVSKLPANDNEKLGEYVSRLVNAQAA